jgi:fucose permease
MSLLVKAKRRPEPGLIVLAFVAFIALGLPDGLLGVGWPSIRTGFGIPLDAIGMLLVAGVAGYMTSSFLSGFLLSRVGVGRLLAASCFLTGLALIGYTVVLQWWMMVLLGVFAGFGAGAIDAGLNTYVAAHFGDGLMQLLHASWGVGTTLGPLVMTLGLTVLNTWRFGYHVVGGVQLMLAACFALTLTMWNRSNVPRSISDEKKLTDYRTRMGDTLRQPRAWLSVVLFFLYVGAEGGLGIWTFSLLTESRGMDEALAGFFAGSYWFSFTIGRIVAGLVADRVGVNNLVQGGLLGALLGAGLLIWNPSEMANLLAVAVIGLSIAPIFPAMMSGTATRVGRQHAANTIGMQMAAAGLGMAVIPSVMGVLAQRNSLEIIPLALLALCAVLLGSYILAAKSGIIQPSAGSAAGKHIF